MFCRGDVVEDWTSTIKENKQREKKKRKLKGLE